MRFASLPGYTGFSSGAGGQAYNQTAFRHFLGIERRRAQRSMRSLFVVLVTVRPGSGAAARVDGPTARSIFLGLGESIREVDFAGWLREGRVAAAVLAPGTVPASLQAQQLLAERVKRAIAPRLPSAQAKHLHVRILPVMSRGVAPRWTAPAVKVASGH